MSNTDNRRIFIKQLGLFSTLCFAGINECIAKQSHSEPSSGFIINANEGEVCYIGNTRKAKVILKISKTSEYTPEISLLTETIVPGDGIPIHKHLNEEEFLFVQKGNVEITLGDDVKQGAPGDLIYVPKETWHGFTNKSIEDVTMFFGYSPAGFEDYFRAIGTRKIDEDLGFTAEEWRLTNKKFGVVYKG